MIKDFLVDVTLKFPFTEINVSVDEGDRVRRKRNNRKSRAAPELEPAKVKETVDSEPKKETGPSPVLMVEVENISHEKFRQTEEVKVKSSCYECSMNNNKKLMHCESVFC